MSKSAFIQVNKVSDTIELRTRNQLNNAYKTATSAIDRQMADIYKKYSVNGVLSYSDMTKYHRLDSMLTEINGELKILTGITAKTTKQAAMTSYMESYYRTGFIMEKTSMAKLSYTLLDPKVIQASVENPISGLKLSEILQKNRTEVVRNIKTNITQGLIQGESYPKMARRISDTLDKDNVKAMRVVRTEVHRNTQQGALASAEHASKLGLELEYVWVANLDDRTRDAHALADGQVAKVVDGMPVFTLVDGVTANAPGMTGVAHHDINCRCILQTRLKKYKPEFRRIKGEGVVPYKNYDEWAKEHGIKSKLFKAPSLTENMIPSASQIQLASMINNTKTSMGDAIKDGRDANSLGKYQDKDGNLLAEREQLHQDIINDLFKGIEPEQGQPVFVLMGGGPATGKSSVIKSGDVVLKNNTVKIDSDAIKAKLPEYQIGIKTGDTGIASFVHEESSALAKRAMEIANRGNYNTLLDGTGDGSMASLTKKITQARESGARVVANYVTCPIDEALRRNAVRAAKTGRLPPEDMLIRTHKAVSEVAPKAANLFDEVSLYDTTDGVKLIATGGNGTGFVPVKGMESLYEDFLRKAIE
jgi:SPP1 gp7 family putative phage head morphogenesis protein